MITSTNYAGVLCVLVHKESGQPVEAGEHIERRDEVFEVTGGSAPHKEDSTGRVWVRYPGGSTGSFFPGVLNTEWRPIPEHYSEWLAQERNT